MPPGGTSLPSPRGRGSAANIGGRFDTWQRERPAEVVEADRLQREQAPDDTPLLPDPRTELLIDTARSVLTRNQSPDLPFDRSINPYRGCEHGCVYCYARPSHNYLGLSPGLDFETKIFHKPDAPELLAAELAKPGYACAPIALGVNTDAYQPLERQTRLTRRLLDLLLACRHPVMLITKGALIERDLDLLAALAAENLVTTAVSLTSLSSELSRRLEPRAAAPQRRLAVIRTLAEAGVPVGVSFAPLIPGLNDHELEKGLEAARRAGAAWAHYGVLRLPHEVAPLFEDWLARHAPGKAARVMAVLYDMRGGQRNDPRFGHRLRGLGHYAELMAQRFRLAHKRLGYGEAPHLDCSRFTPPAVPRQGPANPQLSLF
ncbi:radical SAM family protein [Oryzomicrobium terrae]|uniref:Radical SAM family protein n=2 Tax=Oryzomicrobium terrae TaxID=1735038 RepID=A0A5C1E9V8_9RHOO|nr:radical SAM family protein [Oryzomicrobium terrae]